MLLRRGIHHPGRRGTGPPLLIRRKYSNAKRRHVDSVELEPLAAMYGQHANGIDSARPIWHLSQLLFLPKFFQPSDLPEK